MNNSELLTIPFLAGESFRKHSRNRAMGFVGEDVITYYQLEARIMSVMRLLEDYSVTAGDRVAILSTSMPNWGVSYFAVTMMGAVAVPILPDFTPGEIANVLEHSGSKVLIVSDNLSHKVSGFHSDTLETVIAADDFRIISGSNGKSFHAGSGLQENTMWQRRIWQSSSILQAPLANQRV